MIEPSFLAFIRYIRKLYKYQATSGKKLVKDRITKLIFKIDESFNGVFGEYLSFSTG